MESAQHLFDLAQAKVPPRLRASVEDHWRALREHLREFPRAGIQGWVPALPRVFAPSEFVARTCVQHPGVLRELVAHGDLFRAYRAGEIAGRVSRVLADAPDETALKARLRSLRRREMLRIAFRDLAGWADLGEVVGATTELADACLEAAGARLSEWAVARHGPPIGESGAPVGLVVLGLGKLGGRELNFSSDIDLIFAYAEEGETRPGGAAQPLSNHEFFVRLCQRLVGALADVTADGFVFRVDTRLRPFGESGPLALSFDALEQYYQVHGREWERYALIKARVAAGDRTAGAELLGRLRPFVYRRYLDYGAFEAIRSMKNLIEREVRRKGLDDNIKLGWGGIREVEFLVQTLQMIRGGREPALQEPHLLAALARLAARGYMEPAARDELAAAYVFLRNLEHRLQMVQDSQTQALPHEPSERERIAFACGYDDWPAFAHAATEQRSIVQRHFAEVLSARDAGAPIGGEGLQGIWLGTEDADAAERALRHAGYRDAAYVGELLKALREGSTYRAFSAEGRSRADQLMPLLLAEAGRSADPDTTLARLIRLLEAIGRRSSYLALLIESPQVMTQLVKLCAASPWVAGWIAQHPILLDELLDSRELYELPDRAAHEAELAARLETAAPGDLEAQMNVLREVRNSHLLRVAAADLGLGLAPDEVGAHLSGLADVLLGASLELAYRLLVERHGVPGGNADTPEPGFAVIGYGKLGSLELGYGSDLDMIFLYDDVQGAQTAGPRPVPNELFFARLGQRLIHVLTARTPAGILYEVDMRLRPSGNAGPLVTSLPAFTRYQETQAWTWEHQALVRARPVAGKAGLRAAFEQARQAILSRPRDEAALRRDVREMRERMAAARAGGADGFDVKHDRGGIVDIEFMVQYWVLRWAHAHPDVARPTDNIHIMETLAGRALIPAAWAEVLIRAYRRFLALEQRLKLMEREGRVAPAELGDLPQAVRAIWNEVFGRE